MKDYKHSLILGTALCLILGHSVLAVADVGKCQRSASEAKNMCTTSFDNGQMTSNASDANIGQSYTDNAVHRTGANLSQATTNNVGIWSGVVEQCKEQRLKCKSDCDAVRSSPDNIVYADRVKRDCEDSIDRKIAAADQARSSNLTAQAEAANAANLGGDQNAEKIEELTPTQQALRRGASENPYSNDPNNESESQISYVCGTGYWDNGTNCAPYWSGGRYTGPKAN